MSTVTAADYGWIRTADVFRTGLEIGYALTLARGLARAGAGRDGAEPLGAHTAGSRAVVHTSNGGKPVHFFDWYEDGALRTHFAWASSRLGGGVVAVRPSETSRGRASDTCTLPACSPHLSARDRPLGRLRAARGADMRARVYRITPYDPAERDENDRPRGLRWPSIDRDAVVELCSGAVEDVFRAVGADRFVIDNPMLDGFAHYSWRAGGDDRGLAGLFGPDHTGFHDGAYVPRTVAIGLVRAMLCHAGAWCRLRADSGFFVHVGDELDVYVGGVDSCAGAVERARASGLHVDLVDRSPYDPLDDEVEELPPGDDAFWTALAALAAERGGVLLEEAYVRNGSRWHSVTTADIDAVRAGLAPRARLSVWPDLIDDSAAVAALLRPGQLDLLVVRQRDGRVFTRIAEKWMVEPGARGRGYLEGSMAAVVPLTDRHPLLAAVLPDADGVVRGRWRGDRTRADERLGYLRGLRRGEVCGGVVVAALRFGVFVALDGHRGECLGFINVPELSWRRFEAVTDVVEVGQRIRVQVLGVDVEREQAALSLRALRPDPVRRFADTVARGRIMRGTVTRLVPFGAFVRVEDGVEGLIHLGELADHAVGTPGEVVREGDAVDVVLLGVDRERRRISFSLKRVERVLPRPDVLTPDEALALLRRRLAKGEC